MSTRLCRLSISAIYPNGRKSHIPSEDTIPFAFYLEQTSKLIPNVLPLHPPVRRLKTYLLHLPDIPVDIDRAKRALNALV